jgi:hypothetical protein
MENQSKYDPSRKTVGAIYRDAQMSSHDSHVINEDLTAVMMSSLVEDLNETICDGSIEHGNKPFYITVHEKKDLQMPRALLRRMIKTKYRPYPEDDTMVFYVDPAINDIRFCWCLPHWSEMENMIANHQLFHDDLVNEIRAWKAHDLHHFGFMKDEMGNWKPNPKWKDKVMGEDKPKFKIYSY